MGRANDLGMLTDVGMIKGLMQTQTALGPWKKFLQDNPFDIRRAYVACGVAAKLVGTTLLGRPAEARQFRFGAAEATVPANPAHAVFVARTDRGSKPRAMQIRLKLMGMLKARTPAGGTLEVADGATIDDVLRALDIDPQAIRVFTVNGVLERDRRRVLDAGDELVVIPPVGGG